VAAGELLAEINPHTAATGSVGKHTAVSTPPSGSHRPSAGPYRWEPTAARLRFQVAAPTEGTPSCFAYVQTYDTKPKRRLFEALKAQGMAANQQVTFLTDGGEDIRDLPCYLNPDSEHLLDWFHLTMRITVMTNMAKSLQPPPPDPDLELSTETATKLITEVRADLERLKWFLWHGNVFRALTTVDGITIDLETLNPNDEPPKLLKAGREFDS